MIQGALVALALVVAGYAGSVLIPVWWRGDKVIVYPATTTDHRAKVQLMGETLVKHYLGDKVRFVVGDPYSSLQDRMRTEARGGVVLGAYTFRDKKIILNAEVIDRFELDAWQDTVRHEIAHALAEDSVIWSANHGLLWQAICALVTHCRPQAYANYTPLPLKEKVQ